MKALFPKILHEPLLITFNAIYSVYLLWKHRLSYMAGAELQNQIG